MKEQAPQSIVAQLLEGSTIKEALLDSLVELQNCLVTESARRDERFHQIEQGQQGLVQRISRLQSKTAVTSDVEKLRRRVKALQKEIREIRQAQERDELTRARRAEMSRGAQGQGQAESDAMVAGTSTAVNSMARDASGEAIRAGQLLIPASFQEIKWVKVREQQVDYILVGGTPLHLFLRFFGARVEARAAYLRAEDSIKLADFKRLPVTRAYQRNGELLLEDLRMYQRLQSRTFKHTGQRRLELKSKRPYVELDGHRIGIQSVFHRSR